MKPTSPSTTPGRPRDTTIDERAIEAAQALLLSDGFDATTMQAVADRSGVHTSALYRRWPSPLELIEEAVFRDLPPGRVIPTGDLHADLTAFLRSYLATFESPLVKIAMPGLIARDRRTTRSARAWAHLSVRPQFHAILAAAPSGDVDLDVDPDEVFDLILGAVFVRVIVPDDARHHPPVERTVALVLRLLTPPGAEGVG